MQPVRSSAGDRVLFGIRERLANADPLGACLLVWTCALVLNTGRALRFPHPYAKGHWLFTYEHGFVKRGLPGTLIQPWLFRKDSAEIGAFLDGLGLVLLVASFGVGLAFAYRVLRRAPRNTAWWLTAIGVTTYVLSPFIVSSANLCGYFDHLLMLGTFAGVALLRKDRVIACGLLGGVLMLSHEMFLLFGLPVWCWVVWLRWGGGSRVASILARWRSCLWLLGPSFLVTVVIAWGERVGAFRAAGQRVFDSALKLDVVPKGWLEVSTHPLRVTVSQNVGDQLPRFLEWLTSDAAMTTIHPTTLAFAGLGGALLWPRVRDLAVYVAVLLAPVGIAMAGWDWQRFMMMTPFHGFVAILVLLEVQDEGQETPASTRDWNRLGIGTLVALFAIGSSLGHPIFLTAPGGVERAFRLEMPDPYRCDRVLFKNSDFRRKTLSSWTVEGDAFHGQPFATDVAAKRGSPALPHGRWVGSYEVARPKGKKQAMRGRRSPSDAHRGRLRSVPFTIEGDTIVFRVGGGQDQDHVYVRLMVDDEEVFRVAGKDRELLETVRWDVRPFAGRRAIVEIVDDSDAGWGHINAEGFCYRD